MATAKSKKPLTTRDNLSALIASARKILRKDKGLNGDVDRLPLLTWVMFLKFLDDLEFKHEQEAALDGKRYQPIIEKPYRWRDWATREDGITGDELLDFVGQEHAHRADGSFGQGLFAYLRALAGEGEKGSQREVIANVFKGVQNRMVSGYLLRDIVNKINGIHFNASEEIHTLSHLYESMLREMRDAAGDSGEFYTPRPVVRFMVQVTDPQLGDTVLDPACGTGGFLACTLEHLRGQIKTVDDHQIWQQAIHGVEKKQLPHLLCVTNMLLHGIEIPHQIKHDNTLARPLRDYRPKERVDVILTNPPFGGTEEPGIEANFPADLRTKETADLFLVLIMHLLKDGGRAAVVLPDGTLFGEGVKTRIKERLLSECNLHTIVRLPNGVFAPYTGIKTNLLFFTKGTPTREVWYYEHPYPAGYKSHSKTKPIRIEEFAAEKAWWGSADDNFASRAENEFAWKVSLDEIRARNYNLDIKNPHHPEQDSHDPAELKAHYDALQSQIQATRDELKAILAAALGGGR